MDSTRRFRPRRSSGRRRRPRSGAERDARRSCAAAAVRSATDANGFGRELAPPRERTTIDAFTGSMEAMEVDQEMIDLRAEVDRLRAAAEAYEAGEDDEYFDEGKRR